MIYRVVKKETTKKVKSKKLKERKEHMHKKAKITYPRFKGIPAVLTAQGFHKGRLDCVEVSVIHCLDGIVINASSREVFHRRRLALPSDSPLLSLLNSSNLPSTSNNSSKQEENKKVGKKKIKSGIVSLGTCY